ncbi:MAG: Sua5/YciO/YrdC/YwlC family protein [Gemmataceae bacterium]|nr:Sua5/YciO/YrdC/YwlC family protein [Gemmataceae bacterium]
MPDVLDWRRDDPQAALGRVAGCLRQGQLVALPTEAGYEAVASAVRPDAVAQLAGRAGAAEPLALVLGEAMEVFDWLPPLRGAALRLLRTFWPGPLTLISGAGAAFGCARDLPDAVRSHVVRDGALALRLPDHEWPAPLRRLTGPLAAAPLPGFPQEAGQIAAGRDQVALIVDAGPSPFIRPPTLVRADAKSAAVVREGAVRKDDIEAVTPCRILFVCTGNTCRSPLAETLCRALLSAKVGCASADLLAHGYSVASAGLAAGAGNTATPEAAAVAQAYGGDLRGHCSQPLTIDLLSRADQVFTMTWSQLSLLRSLRVPAGPVPQLLAPAGADVEDPVGGSDDVYRACAAQIWHYLNERLPQLLEA